MANETKTTAHRINDAEAKTLKNRLLMAEKYCEKNFKHQWERSLQLYKGEHFRNMQRSLADGAVVVNYLLHTAETKVAGIAFRYPEFTIIPLTEDSQAYTEIAHSALRYEWKMAKVQRESRRVLKDKEIFGTGIIYTGWLFETKDGIRWEEEIRLPAEGEEQDTTQTETEKALRSIPVQEVREDRFFVKRINPGCFLVDPECGRVLEEAEFCGYWELRSLVEVKKNPHWKNTRQIKGTARNLKGYFTEEYLQLSDEDTPYDVRRVKLFHYYERRRRLHVIFCEEHDKPLYVETWNRESDHYPFRYLQGPGDEDTFYGMSPMLLIEAPQMELNEARSQLRRHRRMAVPRYQTRTGNLSRQGKEQIKDCIPLGVVETNGDPITPIQPLTIQPEVYQTEGRATQDMQVLAALDQYQLGRPPSKRITTTEVEAIQSIGGARSQSDRQDFEQFCSEIALDCLNYLKQFSVKTRELPIYDVEGNIKEYWPDFSGDQIKGQYDIDVHVGSTSVPRSADILEGMAFWTQSFPPFLQAAVQAAQLGIDLTELVRETIRVIPGIRNVSKIMAGFDLSKIMEQAQMQGQPGMEIPEEGMPGDEEDLGGMEEIPPEMMGEEIPQEGEIPPDLLAALMATR